MASSRGGCGDAHHTRPLSTLFLGTSGYVYRQWRGGGVYPAGLPHRALCVPVRGRVHPDLVTTASFAYLRMHAGAGPGGGFTDDQLRAWAGRARGLRHAGKQVYLYFNK